MRNIPLIDDAPDGWFLEAGIGEDRAILLQQGKIVEACIERHGGIKAGMVAPAQLTSIRAGGKGGVITLETGEEALIGAIPDGATQGQSFNAQITREAIKEQNRVKLPQAKFTQEAARPAPNLQERLSASSDPIQTCLPGGRDHFAEAGWGDVLEQARSGVVSFAGGNLDIAVTPAMITIDIDGDMDALPLSIAAAREAAHAIRRLGLRGSIGLDFPDVGGKSGRVQVLEAFDEAMTVDCERTAINGFGLLHLVTRRVRPSLIEIQQGRKTLGYALDLIRQAQWLSSSGDTSLTAHPAITGHFEKHPEWMAALAKDRGGAVILQAEPKLSIGGGYAG